MQLNQINAAFTAMRPHAPWGEAPKNAAQFLIHGQVVCRLHGRCQSDNGRTWNLRSQTEYSVDANHPMCIWGYLANADETVHLRMRLANAQADKSHQTDFLQGDE